MNNFWRYYNNWERETRFLSIKQFDNENFEALLDPQKVELQEFLDGCEEVLRDGDSFIIHALDKRMKKELGKPLIEYNGYVPLSDACNMWRKILKFIKNHNENFEILE